MGYEEFVFSALSRGKEYNQLPATLQAIITYEDYQQRVLEHWIGRGAEWAGSPAQSACGEAEYYEALIKSYKSWLRVYPYHLAGYVCRVMRVTPFKYYSDMICTALVAERPYHQLPNFTAADAVRILGIGRNEYIAMLNTCKGRRLLWRVNRMSVAKEVMPAAPQAVKTEPWWRVACVNLSDGEFRELGLDEMAALKSAGMPGAHLVVGDLNKDVLLGLWKKGLVYLEVPVHPTDRYTIPPLEGFVSNKDAAAPLGARAGTTGPGTDPLEALLYAVFVANSERLRVEELAGILNQGVPDVCTAMSLACRLGFATRVDPPASSVGTPRASLVVTGGLEGAGGSTGASIRGRNSNGALFLKDDSGDGGELGSNDAEAQALAAQLLGKGRPDGRAVALVLDAEATSFLMMGALSPGLKRHAVTLFEGGRVAGEALISEFASELWASHAQGQAFEGDMARLAQFAGALATALDVARAAAGPSCAVELLRKESLAGLQPAAAAKVLATAYSALLPVTPLPHPPLPLALNQPAAPAYFGPTVYSMSPWSALALYHTAGCGPVSIALCCGQRLWRLPDALTGATHALVWSWDVETDAARAKAAGLAGLASDGGPSLVDSPMLLFTLNELLARSAVLVQPINANPAAPPVDAFSKLLLSSNGRGSGIADTDPAQDQSGAVAEGAVVDVPLPLSPDDIPELLPGAGAGAAAKTVVIVKGVLRRTAEQVQVPVTAGVLQALTQLGVAQSLGMLRVIQLPGQAGGMSHGPTRRGGTDPGFTTRTLSGTWLPLSLHMGLPLYCLPLCKAVCAQAQAMGFLSTAGQVKQVEAQHVLQRNLDEIIARFATWREPLGVAAKTSRVSFSGSGARTVGVSYGVIDLPVVNLLFDGSVLSPLDVSDCVQGGGLLSMR